MQEEEYIKEIEQQTGLKLDRGDFGFICGTRSPFTSDKAMISANMTNGYQIWKRFTDKDGNQTSITLTTPGINLKETIDFLIDHEDYFKNSGYFSIESKAFNKEDGEGLE